MRIGGGLSTRGACSNCRDPTDNVCGSVATNKLAIVLLMEEAGQVAPARMGPGERLLGSGDLIGAGHQQLHQLGGRHSATVDPALFQLMNLSQSE
jgi:hypothetical protein